MAAVLDDIQVSPIDGTTLGQLMNDETTAIGWFVELRGVAATIATSECVLTYGGQTVNLTTDHTTAGQILASVTEANLTTLNAAMLDTITGWMEGTVTDGSVTHRFRYEIQLIVTDRLFRFPIVYSELEAMLPKMAKACTFPGSQTNWFPQVRIACRIVRNKIDRQQGDVKTFLLSNPAQLKELIELACFWKITEVMADQDNGRSRMAIKTTEYEIRYNNLWAEIPVSAKANQNDWQDAGYQRYIQIKPVRMWASRGGNHGRGGPL